MPHDRPRPPVHGAPVSATCLPPNRLPPPSFSQGAVPSAPQGAESPPVAERPTSRPPNRYLPFFSRFPSMSNSCFWPPNSDAPFPLSLSPVIVSLYSMGILFSINTRTAEKVRSPAFSFTSLSFVSFWSGQLIVPASLSPSFLIDSVDIRFWPPISYSHFQVPTGSAFSPCAPARPQSPSPDAAERIAFMFASKEWRVGSRPTRTASSR